MTETEKAELLELRAERDRKQIAGELGEVLRARFDDETARGVAETLAAGCRLDSDGVIRHALGGIGAADVVGRFLSGPGAFLQKLARDAQATETTWDKNRVAEPSYGAKWRAADPEGYRKAFDEYLAEKAKIRPRVVAD